MRWLYFDFNMDESSFALYRKYRPQTLDDVCGQKTVVNTIRKWFKSKKIPQVIALFGISGGGKTTIARIIAKELDAQEPFDYREVNVADETGIEAVRGVIEALQRPSMRGMGHNRVFFLDEMALMTKAAQNALLKPLEEIRPHQYVLFSTTNPEKVEETLKNRAEILNIKPLTAAEMAPLLDRVLQGETIQLDERVRSALLGSANGSARQLLTTLQRVLSATQPENQLRILEEIGGVFDEDTGKSESVRNLGFTLTYKDSLNAPELIGWLTQALEEMPPEGIRLTILAFLRGAIVKGKNPSKMPVWAEIMKCFRTPYYTPCSKSTIYADVIDAMLIVQRQSRR
jgi:replication-associated recombination protein RarA